MPEPSPETVESLFQQALDLAPGQRGAFLDQQCAGDAELRAAVEELLLCDAKAQSTPDFLHSPAAEARAILTSAERPVPESIGRYRIVRRLGEGGMGTVYEALQDDPPRTVALKVIRPGLDSTEFRKRFVREGRILSRLRYAGIAQVFGAGATDDGQLYLTMEFIRGLPLGEHVRLRELTPPERLELVARVCDAVQHAHEQGIVHRDLKPANVLVDESGQPKVLDFGVAHATDGGLIDSTAHTRTGQLIGTVGYMSPEQVAGDPGAVDVRSDVYSLGVILYELLAERLPYHLEHLPIHEVVRVIQEVEPSLLGSVNRQFRGGIETIVAKALEKDKARRYRSAGELREDLRRYLAHEPIRARPASALYQLLKFTRRHRALVAGTAATVAALILGLVGTILFAVAEARQRAQAEQNALVANQEKSEARFQEYRARIAAAVGALAMEDVADAGRQLDAAPPELRQWEWRHLHSRLDDSTSVIPLPAEGTGFLVTDPDRLRVGTLTDAGLRLTDLEGGEPRIVPVGTERGKYLIATQTRRGLRITAWVGNTAFDLLDETGQVVCHVAVPEAQQAGGIVVSPDGQRLACRWTDGAWNRLGVFEASSGNRTAVCDGHRNGIWGFTFGPDGRRLASGGEDRMVRLWDAATGTLLATCRGHTSKVLGVAFSPDGARLVTASADGTVRQWDAATGQEVEPAYDRHSSEVTTAVYSPDGQRVASAGADRTVRVWRATGREDVAVLHGHTGTVDRVAFARDGRRLASVSIRSADLPLGDNTVRVWDADTRATLPVLHGHDSYVYPLAFSPDGRWLASGGWDSKVRLWDAGTGEPCATLPHSGIVRSLAFGPDGHWLMTASDGNDRLRIWDVATARVRREIPAPGPRTQNLAVSPDGRRVAASSFENHRLSVCDVTSGEQLFAAAGAILSFSPDGRWLAALDEDLKTMVLRDARSYEVAVRFHGHEKRVNAAVFSPDSRLLATCSLDHTVRLWQVDPLTQPSPPAAGGEGKQDALSSLGGEGKQNFLAPLGGERNQGPISSLGREGKQNSVASLVGEGKQYSLAPSGGEGRVRGCQVLRGHTDDVYAVAFHPDGKRLATGGRDRAVWLWDLERGELVARLPGHTSYIWSLAFSPDGKTLASGSGDFTVRLWDAEPLRTRYQARREAEALRPEAERLVAKLLHEKKDAAQVAAAIRADGSLSEPQRHAALRALLQRTLQSP
jgi:WD40 repeat protein